MIVSRSRHRGDKVVATFFRAEPLETRAKQRPQRLDRATVPKTDRFPGNSAVGVCPMAQVIAVLREHLLRPHASR